MDDSVWLEPAEVQVSPDLVEAARGSRLTAEILARRGITGYEQARSWLDPRAHAPSSPFEFRGMEKAVERIDQAVRADQRIAVWGDFDVDGQTSTAILVEALRRLGADPLWHVPIRSSEGHGIALPRLQRMQAAGLDLLITCDTGITAFEALDWARARHLDVIVTDHHELGDQLPPALAHITPRLLPDAHPMRGMPGAGAAFALAWALLSALNREAEAFELADLAALGIVADVAEHTADVRWLLQRGLEQLRSAARPGIQALLGAARINPHALNEQHIGFNLAPRLNALGRLSDANPAVELLTTQDINKATVIAQTLEAFNASRRLQTRQLAGAAVSQLQRQPALLDSPILILHNPEWPGGIVGLVAGQLAEAYHRPVLLLRGSGEISGSARSVPGVDVTACIRENASLLQGFGGHPLAAGLSLCEENLPMLRRGLVVSVQRQLAALEAVGKTLRREIRLDANLPLSQATLNLADELEPLAPFGNGNPPIVFGADDLTVEAVTPLGREGDQSEHRAVRLRDAADHVHRLLWWGGGKPSARQRPKAGDRIRLAYSLRAGDDRGQPSAMLEWVDSQTLQASPIEISRLPFRVADLRPIGTPGAALSQLKTTQPDALIWAEGARRSEIGGEDRLNLTPADHLVIWTIPPDNEILRTALAVVQPARVSVFGQDPEMDDAQRFLQRLAGLVKYSVSQAGQAPADLNLPRLAAACAQTTTAVRLGLAWLETTGAIRILREDSDGLWKVERALSAREMRAQREALARLRAVLNESSAFRRFFLKTELREVLS